MQPMPQGGLSGPQLADRVALPLRLTLPRRWITGAVDVFGIDAKPKATAATPGTDGQAAPVEHSN